MDQIHLDGTVEQVPDFGGQTYFVIRLGEVALRRFILFLEGIDYTSTSATAYIGSGELAISVPSNGPCTARSVSEREVSLALPRESLRALIRHLRCISEMDAEGEDMPHLHLDTLFECPPEGISDIVLEKAAATG